MQKRKNIIRLLILVVLVLLSVTLFWTGQEKSGNTVNRDLFRPDDTQTIDRVMFHSAKGNVDLTFENNRWKVNSQYEADPSMIKVLFATLKQVEVRRPVALAEIDSVKERLKKLGTEVTLMRAGAEVMKFTAGGERNRNKAWFLKSGDQQPYEVIIPGYRVYTAGILELDEGGWRNKRIFDFNWRNFRTLKAEYLKEPRQGFEIELKGQYFGIKDIPEVDTTKLNNYLDAVSLLFANRFISRNAMTDSLAATAPAIRIIIEAVGNHTYSLDLFTPRRDDAEVYGRLGTREWVTLDRNSMSPIVWKREYFIAK